MLIKISSFFSIIKWCFWSRRLFQPRYRLFSSRGDADRFSDAQFDLAHESVLSLDLYHLIYRLSIVGSGVSTTESSSQGTAVGTIFLIRVELREEFSSVGHLSGLSECRMRSTYISVSTPIYPTAHLTMPMLTAIQNGGQFFLR